MKFSKHITFLLLVVSFTIAQDFTSSKEQLTLSDSLYRNYNSTKKLFKLKIVGLSLKYAIGTPLSLYGISSYFDDLSTSIGFTMMGTGHIMSRIADVKSGINASRTYDLYSKTNESVNENFSWNWYRAGWATSSVAVLLWISAFQESESFSYYGIMMGSSISMGAISEILFFVHTLKALKFTKNIATINSKSNQKPQLKYSFSPLFKKRGVQFQLMCNF